MQHCPNCNNEFKPGERFCGNCGARLPELPPAAPPRQPTGKETVILPSVDAPAPNVPPAANPAQPEKTILAGPAPIPPSQFPASPAPPPSGGQLPPTTPLTPSEPSYPGSTYPGASYPGANLPPGAAAPPPKSGGNNIWKIIGIIAGIGVVACIALAAGAYILINRAASQAGNALSTAAAAGIGTAESFPTFAPIPTFEIDLPTPETTEPTPEDIAPTPEPAATAEAGSGGGSGAVLLRDTFDSASESSFEDGETDNAVYAFADGTYTVKVKQPKLILWKTMRGDYGNVAISVDTTLDGPPESATGLIFHYQDDKNFYIFTVAGDGSYSLDLYDNDELKQLIDWTKSSAIKGPGELNTLRVETQGDSIRLYANDQLLDEVSDSTFSRGKAAIVVNTFDKPNVTVAFDNLVVQAIK
ncbi:MAG TPA: zinc ribbon domain-containing protein [Kouleothrix sp.]|nr:zinc ribbon domain-containing protein [Kouleothrix sp.]